MATSSIARVRANLLAARRPLLDVALRRPIVQDVEELA